MTDNAEPPAQTRGDPARCDGEWHLPDRGCHLSRHTAASQRPAGLTLKLL
jgi:hypothetical protein